MVKSPREPVPATTPLWTTFVAPPRGPTTTRRDVRGASSTTSVLPAKVAEGPSSTSGPLPLTTSVPEPVNMLPQSTGSVLPNLAARNASLAMATSPLCCERAPPAWNSTMPASTLVLPPQVLVPDQSPAPATTSRPGPVLVSVASVESPLMWPSMVRMPLPSTSNVSAWPASSESTWWKSPVTEAWPPGNSDDAGT